MIDMVRFGYVTLFCKEPVERNIARATILERTQGATEVGRDIASDAASFVPSRLASHCTVVATRIYKIIAFVL